MCVWWLEFVVPWGSCWAKLFWLTIDYTCCNILNKLSLCSRSVKVYLKGQGESWIAYLWHLLLLWLVMTSVPIWSIHRVWPPLKWPLPRQEIESCVCCQESPQTRDCTCGRCGSELQGVAGGDTDGRATEAALPATACGYVRPAASGAVLHWRQVTCCAMPLPEIQSGCSERSGSLRERSFHCSVLESRCWSAADNWWVLSVCLSVCILLCSWRAKIRVM